MRALAVAALLAAALAGACGGAAGPRAAARPPGPGELPREDRFLAEVVRNRGYRDMFVPIRDPEFVTPAGDHGIAPQEIVLAADLGLARVCYPVNLLNRHEIVEHRIEGLELLACW